MNYLEHLNQHHPRVKLTVKNLGTIEIELFPEVAPNTVNNFIYHSLNHYYAGLLFHRVIPHFMIQGGRGKNMRPIKGEFELNGVKNDLKHTRGVISMARTSDPNSQTTQFFIMHADAPHLDRNYAAFGGVTMGMDVVDRIANQKRDHSDCPLDDIIIESISVDLCGYEPTDPILL